MGIEPLIGYFFELVNSWMYFCTSWISILSIELISSGLSPFSIYFNFIPYFWFSSNYLGILVLASISLTTSIVRSYAFATSSAVSPSSVMALITFLYLFWSLSKALRSFSYLIFLRYSVSTFSAGSSYSTAYYGG